MKKFLFLNALCALAVIAGCSKDEEKKDEGGNQKPEELVLSAPVITATPAIDAITVSWQAVKDAKTYSVEICEATAEQFAAAGSTAELSYTISNLTAETAYRVRVCAVADKVQSPWSNVASVTTLAPEPEESGIKTSDELVKWFNEEAANCTAEDVVELGADIDLAGKTITPVAEFKGTFDGKGYSIKNLSSSAPLFLKLSGAVKDLTIEGAVALSISEAESTTGHPLAVLANISTGSVTNVTNKASVTMTGTDVLGSPVVAGIVAYQNGGTFTGNKNLGDVTLSHGGTANVLPDGFNRKPFVAVGGVVGVIVGATASECSNEGAIKATSTNVPAIAARHYIGGVVGTPEDAVISACVNRGSVTGDFGDATKAAQKQVWVGGVIGGRNGDVKTVDGALVENCDNYGECRIVVDNASNNYLAGIAGQAVVEAKGTNYTADETTMKKLVNCHNYGKLIKEGVGPCRLGGIQGGAATLENCINDGEILVKNIAASGAVGGLIGYPTQIYHPVSGSQNNGNITVECDVAFALGGLFGQGGNTNQSYKGCSVNCTITAPSAVIAGMVLGHAKTIASGKSIVYGTSEEPFKVKGSLKGTELTTENFATILLGDSTTAGGTIDTSNVQLGE